MVSNVTIRTTAGDAVTVGPFDDSAVKQITDAIANATVETISLGGDDGVTTYVMRRNIALVTIKPA